MESMTITEFINARIDEKEAEVDSVPEWHCTDSARGEGWGSRGDCPLCEAYMFDGNEDVTEEAAWEHLERVHRRSRVLTECEAMRTIVDRVDGLTEEPAGVGSLCWGILATLAAIWSDHADYDEAWR